MDEPLAFPEIDHCLLIHDNRHEDEGASDVELVLFFWPSVVPLSNQIALLGACSWVKAFSQSFTGSPVRVFEMKRFKLAMRSIGNVNFVLTAGLDYSRKSLEIQLDHVVQAFHFYHLSPENMEERARVRIGPDLAAEETERGVISPLRQAIINEYLDGGLVLTPMIQAFHNSLAKNFHPLQHSKHLGAYPDVGNISTSRLLAKASSLIWSASAMEEFISGCVADHEGNIISTHLDVDTTRWVSNYLLTEYSKTATELVVYVEASKVADLMAEKRDFFRAKNDLQDTPQIESAPTPEKEELVAVRLVFLHRPRLTLCLLAPTSVQVFALFHRIDSLSEEISSLESSIQRIDKSSSMESPTPPESPAASSSTSTPVQSSPLRGATILAPGTPPPTAGAHAAGSPTLAVSARTASRALPNSPRPDISPASSASSSAAASHHGPLRSVASTHSLSGSLSGRHHNTYNFLSFSEETQTQEGNIGIRRPDAERNFFESLSFVHDTFNETPQITKVVYRDQQGMVFCRKLFGKETYFQQATSASSGSKFANFEERARETLSSEHNVFLI